MSKQSLVKTIATLNNCTQKAANEALMMVLEGIQEELAQGKKVTLVGFGSFSLRVRKDRIGRNPATGEAFAIPTRTFVRFSAGDLLRSAVNLGKLDASDIPGTRVTSSRRDSGKTVVVKKRRKVAKSNKKLPHNVNLVLPGFDE